MTRFPVSSYPSHHLPHRPSDNGLITETMDIGQADSSNFGAPGSGVICVSQLWIPEAAPISKLVYLVNTQGTGLTAGQNLVGIYNAAGTLLGKSATQESAGVISTGLKEATLTAEAGQSLTVPGGDDYWVYAAMLFVGTTPPALRRVSVIADAANYGRDATTGYRCAVTAGGKTALSSPLPALTPTTFFPAVALA